MRTRHRWLTISVLACLAAACSKNKSGKDEPLEIAGGPKSAELLFRIDSEPAESEPIALTASDGTGLELVSLEARTVIEDPLAFTELHLTFHNPENRRREGRFEIALPAEAAISRFAMEVAGQWQEGEVVERRRAQQIYEDFLHRKQDPALLEKGTGNQFTARVFPIEANADKHLIIAYSEELQEQREPYRLRLKGLPKLRAFKAVVRLGSHTGKGDESKASVRAQQGTLSLEKMDFVPEGDLEVQLPRRRSFALRHGNLVVARVVPVTQLPAAELTGLTVLFDTSASRALGFGAQIEHLDALVKELIKRKGGDFDLKIVAFDQGHEEIYRGAAGGFGVRDHGKLLARDALGASDLGKALEALAQTPSGHTRVLLVGDGVTTAGATGSTELREAVAKLSAHGVRRFDVLAEGGIQDQETLRALTRAGLRHTGIVVDATRPAEEVATKLLLGTKDRVEVRIGGASFVYPTVLEGVQPGDEFLIFAELPTGAPVQIELEQAGAVSLPTLEAPAPLIERAFARAHIEAMTHELRSLRPEATQAQGRLEREIVALSVEQRVVSDFTALLVLESAEDYRRFGLGQTALSNILRVGETGIELYDRRAPPQYIAKGELQEEAPSAESPAFEGEAFDMADGVQQQAGAPGNVADKAGEISESKAVRARSPAQDDSPRAGTAKVASAPARSMPTPSDNARPAAESTAAPTPTPAGRGLGSVRGATGGARATPEISSLGSAAGAEPERDLARSQPVEVARPEEPAVVMTIRTRASVRSVSGLSDGSASSVVRGLSARTRSCFSSNSQADGQSTSFILNVSDKGLVGTMVVSGSTLSDARERACVTQAVQTLRFPKPEQGSARVEVALSFSREVVMEPSPRPTPRARARPALPRPAVSDAYEGDLATVLLALEQGDVASAHSTAVAAHQRDPGDVMALIALGETLEAQKDLHRAARVYGSLIDLFPTRADLRRMASARLERLGQVGLTLAIDSYRQAVAQRPDQPSGHRLLAYALLRSGDPAAAFLAVEHALAQSYPFGRFEGVERILREDLALMASAWLRVAPGEEARIRSTLTERGLAPDTKPSLRFVLNWETDANDVDFHIYDGRGGHAFYMQPSLRSGGALYADVTTGFGPECFAISGTARAYPYTMQAHYFSRGPMGYGMGKLQVVEHDGKGGISLSEHPFVIMKDKAFVQLAALTGPLL